MDARGCRRLALAALSAGALLLAAAGCGSSGGSGPASATARLAPVDDQYGSMSSMPGMDMKGMTDTSASGMEMAPTNAHGSARFRQSGDHLTGTVTVTGLAPNSSHAEHLHGPDGACEPQSKMTPNMALVLPDLHADAHGTATERVDLTVHEKVIAKGYFVMVHEYPTPVSQRGQIGSAPASPAFMKAFANDPGILCGDVSVQH